MTGIAAWMNASIWSFVWLYPVLQIATLGWGTRGTRLASLLCLLVAGPFYVWSLLPPQSQGDVRGIVVILLGPLPVFYQIVLSAYVLIVSRKSKGAAEAGTSAGTGPR